MDQKIDHGPDGRCLMRKCRVWVKTAICALAVVTGGAGLVTAEEISLSNLALKNTYLKGRDIGIFLTGSWQSLFSPTTIACPRGTSGTCTARIEVTVQFRTSHPDDHNQYITCRALRGGVGTLPTLVFPGEVAAFGVSDTPFTWIAHGLPLGPSTISVQCKMPVPDLFIYAPTAYKRTLTIDVYKP
jgi:hypothetical protein